MSERESLIVDGIRKWLDEEDRAAAEARAAADSYRGIDMEAVVDLSRSAARHTNTANRIRKILHEAQA